MIHKDWIPDSSKEEAKVIPRGFDYWEPGFKIGSDGWIEIQEKRFAPKVGEDGDPNLRPQVTQKSITQGSITQPTKTFFQCNHCDFKSEKERAIKIHVGRKHNNSTEKK